MSIAAGIEATTSLDVLEALDWEPELRCDNREHGDSDFAHWHADGGEAWYRITCPNGCSFVGIRCKKIIDVIAAGQVAICHACRSAYVDISNYHRIEGIS